MPTLDERLEDMRKAEAAEAEKVIEADKVRELLVLDLKAKGRATLGKSTEPGVLGRDFAVLEFVALDRVVLLKRAEAIVVKRYNDQNRGKSTATDDQTLQYVVPSVEHPTRDEFKSWVKDHPQMSLECALELRRLEGLRLEEKSGKQ